MAKINQSTSKQDCVVHEHPVPPEEMHRYSMVRDPSAEEDIASYVHGQARDEVVHHVEQVKSEFVAGKEYEIWDVTTDKNRWWVITNGTNLYSQKHFPSLDYTLSFHIGLMMRVMSKSRGADADDPHPFDEVFRRLQQAGDRLERAVEAEEYQAVAMQLRECLLSVSSVMQRRVSLPEDIVRPKAADFNGWSELFLNHLCPGRKNEAVRKYLKAHSEKTWALVGALTHDRNAEEMPTSIAMAAVDTLVTDHLQLVMQEQVARFKECPNCNSRKIRSHFDILIEPDGEYYETCGSCDWSSHPGYEDDVVEKEGVNG